MDEEEDEEEEESGVMWSGNTFLADRESERVPGGQRDFCVIGIKADCLAGGGWEVTDVRVEEMLKKKRKQQQNSSSL